MIQKIHRNNMVWIDMEMTGLDPEKDKILEIATIITDGNLNILAEGPDLVIHQPVSILKGMDQWNQDHHGKSGLIAMDALASSHHIGLIYATNADGTDQIIEAKGEAYGTNIWTRTYRGDSSYGGVRRLGWTG